MYDNVHEKSKPVFWENKENVSKFILLKFLPSILSVKDTLNRYCPANYNKICVTNWYTHILFLVFTTYLP